MTYSACSGIVLVPGGIYIHHTELRCNCKYVKVIDEQRKAICVVRVCDKGQLFLP